MPGRRRVVRRKSTGAPRARRGTRGGVRGRRYGLGWDNFNPLKWGWKTEVLANAPFVALGAAANPILGAVLGASTVAGAAQKYREQKRKERAEAERRAIQEQSEQEEMEMRRQKQIARMMKEQAELDKGDRERVAKLIRDRKLYCLRHRSECPNGV